MLHLLSALAISAIVVTPSSLPAGGTQEATLQLNAPSLVRITARTPFEATCTLVDRRRGPFTARPTRDGACVLEELLDAGDYLLRVEGPSKVPAKAAATVITATPFVERNSPVVRLDDRTAQTTTLALGEQRSYALDVDKPGRLRLRIVGRTAGRIELWREGEWREPLALAHDAVSPTGRGRELHSWTFDGTLEPGSYRLTVYGTEEKRWENGDAPTDLWVSNGATPLADPPGVDVELPWHGFARFELPTRAGAVLATLGAEPSGPVTLAVLDEKKSTPTSTARCEVGRTPLPPVCLVNPTPPRETILRREALIQGPAGSRITLYWRGNSGDLGPFASSRIDDLVEAPNGLLIATHELPATYDMPPLACTLTETPPKSYRSQVLASDQLRIGPDRGLDTQFNYGGYSTRIAFETTAAGTHRVETLGDRKSSCVLRSVDGARVIHETPRGQVGCLVETSLSPGIYVLELNGGIQGIERLRIVPAGARQMIAGKASCVLSKVVTKSSMDEDFTQTRTSTIAGVSVLPLPATFAEPFAATIDPGSPLRIPIAANVAVQVRTALGAAIDCEGPTGRASAKDGRCTFTAQGKGWELVLSAPGTRPLVAFVAKPTQTPSERAPSAPANPPPKLAELALDRPESRDFERTSSHSFVFDVPSSGLYEATTDGLLATSCTLRTPVVLELANDTGSGRGRNCLVMQWLGTGRHRLTVKTQGQSRGRALVRLTRREAVEKAAVTADGESFLRADAGDLVRQSVTIPKDATYRVQTEILGAETTCRLDDARGWPVVSLPSSCNIEQHLRAGRYTWIQLPLTVESSRRTSAERVRPAITFKGNRLRFPVLNREYDAELGPKGRDEYRFDVPARMEIDFTLRGNFVARLVRLEGKKRIPVDMFRSDDGSGAAAEEPTPEPASEEQYEGSSEESSDESSSDESPSYESSDESSSEETYVESDTPTEEYSEPSPPSAPPPQAQPTNRRELEPGVYALVVTHARDDKFVRYRIGLTTEILAPGVTSTVSVPSTRTLRLQSPGLVRLRTRGSQDVRCRVFRDGALVVENGGAGEDWNCALAEPLLAGDYTLVVESETLGSGSTEITVGAPAIRTVTPAPEAALALDPAHVESIALTPQADTLVRIEARADTPFSCAVVSATGEPLHRSIGRTECMALVRVPETGAALRIWTPSQPSSVKLSLRTVGIDRDASAKRVDVASAGRFKTDADTWCLGDAARGALKLCGPEASLDAGRLVVARFDDRTPSAPKPIVLEVRDRTTDEVPLDTRRIDVVRAPGDAIHLLAAESSGQQSEPPGCGIAGGVRVTQGIACYSALGIVRESTHWVWPTGTQPGARIERVVVELPKETRNAALGHAAHDWKSGALRLAMPKSGWRAELLLPARAWAVALVGGRVQDLCPPSTTPLASCRFLATGGEIVVASDERHLELTVVEADAPVRRIALDRLVEQEPALPGEVTLDIAPATVDRRIEIEGADECLTTFSDGSRLRGCTTTLTAKRGASVFVRHAARPWRALLAASNGRLAALLGPAPSDSGTLEPGRALPPAMGAVARTFTLPAETAIQIRTDGGVCGLFDRDVLTVVAGGERGCNIARVLPAGTHRIVVRPFADRPRGGRLELVTTPVLAIGEGVGTETWLAPGESRTARFVLDAPGKVGIGLRADADVVECRLLDASNVVLGVGCQQLVELKPGVHRLELRNPPGERPLRVRPVVLGLSGTRHDIPDDYLRDLLVRIGAQP